MSSIAVIVYAPSRHFVLAPGQCYYRQNLHYSSGQPSAVTTEDMAAIKTLQMSSTDTSLVRYHVFNDSNNHIQLLQRGTHLVITQLNGIEIILTQQNVADLAAAFSNFGSTGLLS